MAMPARSLADSTLDVAGVDFADETHRLERLGVYVVVVPGAVAEDVAGAETKKSDE